MSVLACPDGYYPFSDIPTILFHQRGWKLRGLPFKEELLNPRKDHSDLPFDPVQTVMLHLGSRLASGELEAAAIISRNGELISVPPSAWRIMDWDRSDSVPVQVSAIESAFNGREIYIPLPIGTFERARPVISGTVLAEAFNAENPPPLPFLKPRPVSILIELLSTENHSENHTTESWREIAAVNDGASNDHVSSPDAPLREEMDAAEVLSWIAFRRAIPLDVWGEHIYHLSRDWPWAVEGFYSVRLLKREGDDVPGGPEGFLALLKDVEAGSDWRRRLNDAPLQTFIEARIETILHAESVSKLASDLKADIANAASINRRIVTASGDLRRALEAGTLQAAAGSRGTHGGLMFGRSRVEAAKWIVGMEIFPDGTVQERNGHQAWSYLLFDTRQILSTWPTRQASDRDQGAAHKEAEVRVPVPARNEVVSGRGGRPPRHDWDAFWIEIAIWCEANGFEVKDRPRLQKHMVDWTAKNSDDPDDQIHPTTIRKKLGDLYSRANARN